VLGVVCLAVE
jgi:prefoldin subunit 2